MLFNRVLRRDCGIISRDAVLQNKIRWVKFIQVQRCVFHNGKPFSFDHNGVGNAGGGEKALSVGIGCAGICMVGHARTISRRQEVGQPCLINGPDKSNVWIEILSLGKTRCKDLNVRFLAYMKQTHGTFLSGIAVLCIQRKNRL